MTLNFPRNPSLFFLEYLDVIIQESDQTQPDGGHQHQNDIDVGEIGKKQNRDHDGGQDNDPTHGGGSLFLMPVLPVPGPEPILRSVSGEEYLMIRLPMIMEITREVITAKAGPEGEVLEHTGSREIKLIQDM